MSTRNFLLFQRKHTQLTSRDRTSVVASYILLPVLPRCFSFLIWAGLSLCVEECEHLAEAIYSSVRRGSRLRRLAFNMYTENQLSELRDLLCCVAGRKKKKKRVPAVTALDTHRGQVVCVCAGVHFSYSSLATIHGPSRLFLSVYIYTPRDKMS